MSCAYSSRSSCPSAGRRWRRSILTFLSSWNNFLWPLVAAQTEEKYTLPVALSLYSTGQNATNYSVLLAGAVLVVTPILLLFVFLQRYFIQGVAGTGIK